MEQNTFFFLILPLLLNLGAEGVFVPVTSVHWLPSDDGLDSGSIFNSWMKVMKYISPYRAIQRFLEDDQNVDFVQIGVNKKILSLAEDEFGLLKFGKRAD